MRSIAVASATHPFQFQIDMLKKGAPLIETTYGPKSYLSYPCKIRLSNQNRVRCEQKVSSGCALVRPISAPLLTAVLSKNNHSPVLDCDDQELRISLKRWRSRHFLPSRRRTLPLQRCRNAFGTHSRYPVWAHYLHIYGSTKHHQPCQHRLSQATTPQRSVAVNSVTATMNSVTVIVDSLRLSW